MNKSSNGIVQAKEEYTKELINLITDPMCAKLLDIYTNINAKTTKKREVIINTQYALREIPLWNQACINVEVDKIRQKCEFLDDLVAAIFVTNVKILSSIKMGKEKQKIQVTMPKTDQFIHKIYTQAAHTLYDNAYIFSSQYDPQKRKADIIIFVQKSIEDTIRTSLPFRNILQNYLGKTVESDDESEEDVKSESSEDHEIPETPEIPEISETPFEENSDETLETPELSSSQENHEAQLPEAVPETQGFFARPEQPLSEPFSEEKTVPISNPPQLLQQQTPEVQKPPMLFPDASEDPDA